MLDTSLGTPWPLLVFFQIGKCEEKKIIFFFKSQFGLLILIVTFKNPQKRQQEGELKLNVLISSEHFFLIR